MSEIMEKWSDIGFYPADILLPKAGTDMTKWAVVACDQFSSQPDYWAHVERTVGEAPSSLRLILPPIRALLRDDASRVVCLVKPQFEAGRESVGKKGVVRDKAVHREVLRNFFDNASNAGFAVEGLTWSPIRGPEGNIEYLGFLRPSHDAGHGVSLDGVPALVDQT